MMAKLFGANWRTTVSTFGTLIFVGLTWLSSLSYDQGSIAMVVPISWRPWIVKISAGAAVILWAWNGLSQKSKEVTGGSVAQTLDGSVAKPGTQTLVDITKATTDASNGKSPSPPKTI